MQKKQELLKQRKLLTVYKRSFDKNAPLQTWEGMAYARTLVKLVLIEMELEEMEKDACQRPR